MGNCGTREENAVVAAHAQGTHPFEFARSGGFLAGSPLLSVLVWISATSLRIPSKFHFGGLFVRSSGLLVLGLTADYHKYSLFLLWRLLD